MNRWLVVLALLLAAVVLLRQVAVNMADAACPPAGATVPAVLAGQALRLELAATAHSRRCGLSRRDRLASDGGMLFLFPSPRRAAFWMHETRIPLSLAFLDAAGRILAIERMRPDPGGHVVLPRFHAPQPVTQALEVNAGWFDAHGVGVGDQLTVGLPAGLTVQ